MSDTELISGESPLTETAPVEPQPVASPPATGAEPIEKVEKPVKLSLRDQLKENFKAAAEPKEKSPAKQAAVEGRERDEKGRLLPKEKTVEAPKTAAPVETPQPVKDAQAKPGSTPIGPPPGWSAESKALYATLPDPLKADILKREKEVSDGFKKYSDDAKRYQELDQALSPSRASYQQHGLNDAQAVNRLMEWERMIRSNPQLGISNLARQYGVDLASLAQNSPGQSNGQNAVLQQYLQPVTQQLNSVQTELQRMQNERAAQDIAQFSKDKPYFERVKTDMGQLLSKGAAQDLESAYQMAIWSSPEIRGELLKKEVETNISAQQVKAQQARKAAVSPSTRAPSAPMVNGATKAKGVKGSIMSAIEQLREERA